MMNHGRPILPNQKQIEIAQTCPNNCPPPPWMIHMLPRPGSGKDAFSVCFMCGAWWKTDAKGEVVERKQFQLLNDMLIGTKQ